MELNRPYRSVVDWTWRTMPVRLVLFHLFIPACCWAMLADPPYWPYNLVGWVVIGMVLPVFWVWQRWSFRQKHKRGLL